MNWQDKATETAEKYKALPLQDKINVIAQTLGYTSGEIETSPCFGSWRGTSDISIVFDNGTSLFLANRMTRQAKTVKAQHECVNAALLRYNPEIVAAAKEAALSALRKREVLDNTIAGQKGLKPYTVLNVELNNGTDDRSSNYIGWYYVTIAVEGKIHAHLETGLAHDIANGNVSENLTREHYYAAGALKKAEVDYVFNNVGFSTTSTLYTLPIADAVLERAKKALAERHETCQREPFCVSSEWTQRHKPSIKTQLSVKPIASDQSSKPKIREVR